MDKVVPSVYLPTVVENRNRHLGIQKMTVVKQKICKVGNVNEEG